MREGENVDCLVIGATGYVGARLVPRLLDEGHTVRCLVRNKAKLARHTWADRVEVRQGDVHDEDAVRAACNGVDAVFYLVHSMDGPDFADRDRRAVAVLADAAHTGAGPTRPVRRIVYLGGLQPVGDENSEHLASRREVGEILMASQVPTAVLQAGVVVGAGSASYEMIRHLAEASPLLPMPDNAWNAVQPIAIDDVLYHLVACLDLPRSVNRTFDIGGPDVLSFRELILGYAAAAGLPRPFTVPVPLVAPRMISRAVQALTPVGRHLAKPLVESMAHDLVCHGDQPAGPPPGGATPYAEAVRRAVTGEGAAGRGPTDLRGIELVSEQTEQVRAPAAALWDVISGIGGDNGWYSLPGIWALRGGIDRLLGGVGARRGRPERLVPGAKLDWWVVEALEEGRSLTLRAETKMPGTARLEMRAEPDGDSSRYVQRVTFTPRGLAGRAYWYAELPAHNFVFAVMARTIAGVAHTRAR